MPRYRLHISEPWPLSDVVFGEGEVLDEELLLGLDAGSLIDGVAAARVRLRTRYGGHVLEEASSPDGVVVNGETDDDRRFQFIAALETDD